MRVPLLEELGKKHMLAQGMDFPGVEFQSGSSDVGDVSYVCPALILAAEIKDGETRFMPHDRSTLNMADGPAAYDSLHKFINVAVNMSLDMYLDPALIAAMKAEQAKGKEEK